MNNDYADLAKVDLNLLLVFYVVYQSLSVSVAAEQLGVGQPAVSNSLKRLRRFFQDPLFLRSGRNIRPTCKAAQIAEKLGIAFGLIKIALP